MRLEADGGNVIIQESVGIGVSDPSVELEVGGSTNTQVLISTTNNTGNSQVYFGDSDSDSSGIILYRHASDSMAFEVNGSERMRIDSSGNVDIKTVGSATSPSLFFGGDGDTGFFKPLSNTLAFSTFGTERMRIDSSGNVGIGTTSPSAVDTNNGTPKLQVETGASAGNNPLVARFTVDADAGDNSGASILINSGNDRGLMISAGRKAGNVARSTLNIVTNTGAELTGGIYLGQASTSSTCLLYTSPSPRDRTRSRMPSSA